MRAPQAVAKWVDGVGSGGGCGGLVAGVGGRGGARLTTAGGPPSATSDWPWWGYGARLYPGGSRAAVLVAARHARLAAGGSPGPLRVGGGGPYRHGGAARRPPQ